MSCCCTPNNDEALWLPKNSVRAILSLLITIVTFGTLSFMVVYLTILQKIPEAIGICGILSTALSSVISTYFANRNNQETNKKIEEINRRHIDDMRSHNHELIQSLLHQNTSEEIVTNYISDTHTDHTNNTNNNDNNNNTINDTNNDSNITNNINNHVIDVPTSL